MIGRLTDEDVEQITGLAAGLGHADRANHVTDDPTAVLDRALRATTGFRIDRRDLRHLEIVALRDAVRTAYQTARGAS